MKKLTKKQLEELKFEFTKDGFTLWGKDGRWILDGSVFFRSGRITFCNKHKNKIQVEVGVSKKFPDFQEIRLVNNDTKSTE